MDFVEFTSFRKMITPTIIKILFWLGVVMSVVWAVIMMMQGGAAVFLGLVALVLGPIMVRVYCELIIIAFRIYDVLVDIRDGRKGDQAPPTVPPQV